MRFRNYGSKIMDHTFTFTLYHFKIATLSAIYIHFHASAPKTVLAKRTLL